MPQIAQQNYIYATIDEEYYKRNNYPLKFTGGDVTVEVGDFSYV